MEGQSSEPAQRSIPESRQSAIPQSATVVSSRHPETILITKQHLLQVAIPAQGAGGLDALMGKNIFYRTNMQ